jgi:hypothetical protein
MAATASQICAYLKSDASTPAMSDGEPPERLKCSASTRTEALAHPDFLTTRTASASVLTPV